MRWFLVTSHHRTIKQPGTGWILFSSTQRNQTRTGFGGLSITLKTTKI